MVYLAIIVLLIIGILIVGLKKCNTTIIIPNTMVKNKYDKLVKIIGEPTYQEKCQCNKMKSSTWMAPLEKFNDFGKFGGCDYIKIMGTPSKKYHPHPAKVFLIVGRYMKVPEHLLGPLKHASETINIEQLFVPESYAQKYFETGEKDVALVTGSCASVTISAITVKFVEDMIKQYEGQTECLSLYDTFRQEYDRRINDYLCGKGITNDIPWFDINFWEEPEIYNIGNEKCGKIEKNNTNVQNNNVSGLKTVMQNFVEPFAHAPS